MVIGLVMESELSRKLLPGEFDGKNVASSNARSDLSYNYVSSPAQQRRTKY